MDGSTSAIAALRLEGVAKSFGGFVALRDVNLAICPGELVCFLGPSGCGKTTLLRIVAGLDMQTAGRVWQGGRDVSRLPPAMRDFGIVFQSYALFPNLNVADNIGYGLVNRKMVRAAREARVAELLALIGLEGSGTKYPAQLSGGQQQRVALARALATSPGLLLLDEPLSALDARVRLHLRREIRALQQRLGVTTILVTHDQEEALTMADRVVVMNHGVIEQVGTPEEIYEAPRSRFVAAFIGTMNFLPGRVVGPSLVEAAGVAVACDTSSLAIGAAVEVAVRPEDVLPGVAAGPTATVQALEFLGAGFRVTLGLQETPGAMVVADLGRTEMHRLGLRLGSVCRIGFAPHRASLFAAP